MNDLLGENGGELWAKALKTRDCANGSRYPVTPTPPEIASAFLQVAHCDYPHRVKRLFFESKFMEILSRITADGLPETAYGADAFEAERIKTIPGILMERIDTPPSIAELAHELSLNSTTMKRGFKNIFGEPIYAHHRNMCLKRAATMLLETDKPVFEIAVDAGYSGSGNFCNAFKNRYGVSPTQYRRRQGKRRL
ncbi:MAG: AraC family transcriptional regulator [Synergistaceae bacterium]|nr:AraC family transcriptional regulator [Synergistaceae bacterium]